MGEFENVVEFEHEVGINNTNRYNKNLQVKRQQAYPQLILRMEDLPENSSTESDHQVQYYLERVSI